MKIIRFIAKDGTEQLAGAADNNEFYVLEGDLFHHQLTKEKAQVQQLLAPLKPVAILGIGLNYKKHAIESNLPFPQYPVLFAKGNNTLQHPQEPIVLPRALWSEEVDYECELAVVIGKKCKNATPENALEYVLGYTCANDVSARDWQLKKGGGQWCRGKFFDTFAPLGPCLVTTDEITNPNSLDISTTLNGELVQQGNTRDMIFSVPELIAFLSAGVTLEPGTVILTGTPEGVGMSFNPPKWLKAGDKVTIAISQIGELMNPVEEECVN